MLLGYKAPPGETPYWFGKHEGVDRKFVRVIAGVVLPQLERQMGALVVIGELFRSFGLVGHRECPGSIPEGSEI